MSNLPNDTKTPGGVDKKDVKKPFNRFQNKAGNLTPKPAKFEGDCDDLKGYIFEYTGPDKADVFAKTCKKLQEYVGKTWFKNHGSDIHVLVKTLQMPVIPQPDEIDEDNATSTAKAIWKKKIDIFVAREEALEENNRALYALVLGQCSETLRTALASQDSFEEIDSSLNGLMLLQLIKSLVYQFHSQKYLGHSIHESIRRLAMLQQPRTMTVNTYLEHFQNLVEVIEHTGGTIGYHNGMIAEVAKENNVTFENVTPAQLLIFREKAKERFLAVSFLLNADRSRFGRLIEDTENGYLRTRNSYPETVTEAYNLLVNWKQDPRNYAQVVGGNDGISFGTVGDGVTLNTQGRRTPGRGKNAPDISTVTCYKCGLKGHYSPECPSGDAGSVQSGVTQTTATGGGSSGDTTDGVTLLMHGVAQGEFDETHYQFLQDGAIDCGTVLQTGLGGAGIPESWILLDSQSTIDVFRNKELLNNVRETETRMRIHSNAGTVVTNLVGDYPGYGTVWYDPNGIANILSMSSMVNKGYDVHYDSKEGNQFVVKDPDGSHYGTFKQAARGLYYQDLKAADAVAMVATVDENKSKYTNRDYQRALLARKIQRIIGRPSTRQYIKIIDNHQLPNCPINKDDIIAAEHIFGPDVGSLKGKTVRRPGYPVETRNSDIPASIMSRYRTVTLCGDIMFVNRVPIFMTISRGVKFGTAQMVSDQKADTLLMAIKQVKAVYSRRGFVIETILMDGQFEPLRGGLADLQVTLNTVANDEHVPEIERYIRTVKERMRSVYNTLPFERLPGRMVTELAYYAVYWLNNFPALDGISDTLSPRAIVVGSTVDFTAHCRLEYGTYVQTHEQHDNSMDTRTTGAIALRPTGNLQGGHHFYSLNTGRVLRRNRWTSLPMPAEVIARIHLMARRNRGNPAGLHMTDRNGDAILDDEDDEEPSDDGDDDGQGGGAGAPIAQVDVADGYVAADHQANDGHDADFGDDDGGGDDDLPPMPGVVHDNAYDAYGNQQDDGQDDIIDVGEVIQHEDDYEVIDVDDDEDVINPDADHQQDALDTEMDQRYGARTGTYNLRPRKPINYSHLHISTGTTEDIVDEVVVTQYGVKKGLEMFGEDGANAIIKELRQLHDRNVISPVMTDSLTHLQKKQALAYLMFLKQKRTGEIKARGCADGRPQRQYINKEDASSPTVATESVFITSVIDAFERREVATVDVPGAFMQVDMDELVHIVLKGTMAKLLLQVCPETYARFMTTDSRGQIALYLVCNKALYGTMRAALLFWEDLSSKLQGWGFELNPYDQCVANKMIEGTQCTVVWHVDDIKISHVSPEVVTGVISLLQGVYGTITPLAETRGKQHDYLGMQIDLGVDGKVRFSMIDYIKNVLDETPPEFEGESATPAASHLFEVNESSTPLEQKQSESFHHMVAQLLFLCKRARPDI